MAEINPLRYRGYYYDTETQLYYLQSRYYDPTTCRFINADALASTGQGVLGHNMFAYCLNNPISYIDSAGEISIWYYLFIDSEFGFIHTLVQLHILSQYGSDYAMERTLKGHGRADIVNEKTGRVWEIKHASTIPARRASMAQIQAIGYIGGTYTSKKYGDVTITGLGAASTFTGSFIIFCMDIQYQVDYWTPCLGVILYSVREIKESSKEPSAVYVPKKVKEPQLQKDYEEKLVLGGLVLVGGVCFLLRAEIFDGDPDPLIAPCK